MAKEVSGAVQMESAGLAQSPERVALSNAVNTAVYMVTKLEVELRAARVAERRARAALAELA